VDVDHDHLLNILQAAALLLFNNADRLSYSEIMTQLNLNNDDVVRLLHSLSCAKYKILTKEPNTRTVSPTDNFEFNYKFTDRMRKIKVFCILTLIYHLNHFLLPPPPPPPPPPPKKKKKKTKNSFFYCFLCIKILKIFNCR
jgi:hypothetical protein